MESDKLPDAFQIYKDMLYRTHERSKQFNKAMNLAERDFDPSKKNLQDLVSRGKNGETYVDGMPIYFEKERI